MKTVILNVRVPEYLRNALIEESSNNDVLISDTIRTILNSHYEDNNEEEIYDDLEFENDFYNSNQFLYLVSWIFEKKGQPNVNCEKHILIELKNIVLKVIEDNSLPDYLIEQFENVLLIDLLRVIKEYNIENTQFRFCKLYENDTLDYTGLTDYIAFKAFENRVQL